MRKTKEDTERTKKRIIEQSVRLFLKNGFSNTTLEEIARQADVTRGAIYWHFKDKLDILDEMIETEHQNLIALLSDLFSENVPPISKLDKIVTEIVGHFYQNTAFRNFIELTWFKIEYTQFSRLLATKAELTDYFINNLRLVVRDAINCGEIKTGMSELDISITITHMINGMYRMYFTLPHRINTEEEALSSFKNYLNLLKT